MCVNCFVDGKSDERYAKPQSYHVLNKLDFPLYESTWTAEEELLLLEGMEKYGFGNWGDIADHISSDKTWEDVYNHYESVYIAADGAYDKNDILTTRDSEGNLVIKSVDGAGKAFGELEGRRKKGTNKQGNEKKNYFGQKTYGGGGLITKDTGMNAGDVIGYMPLREDFDYEYDNEAELFLAELEFNGKGRLFEV